MRDISLICAILTLEVIMNKKIFDKNTTCCFTGPRPQNCSINFDNDNITLKRVKNDIRKYLIEAINNGYINFLCGMALGFDTLCFETLIEIKKEFQNIKLISVLPCKDQCKFWYMYQQNKYYDLLKQSDETICLYDKFIGARCMIERNEFMVSNSSLLIALNSNSNGTQFTINFAKKQHTKVILIEQ